MQSSSHDSLEYFLRAKKNKEFLCNFLQSHRVILNSIAKKFIDCVCKINGKFVEYFLQLWKNILRREVPSKDTIFHTMKKDLSNEEISHLNLTCCNSLN